MGYLNSYSHVLTWSPRFKFIIYFYFKERHTGLRLTESRQSCAEAGDDMHEVPHVVSPVVEHDERDGIGRCMVLGDEQEHESVEEVTHHSQNQLLHAKGYRRRA